MQQTNFRCTYFNLQTGREVWDKFADREGREKPTKKGEWKPKFHKKNSKRPQSQLGNVVTVSMSLTAFYPGPEGFCKTRMGRVGWEWKNGKKNGVLVWAGAEPSSSQQLAQSWVWAQCEKDADNTLLVWLLLSCVYPTSRTFLCLVFCQ